MGFPWAEMEGEGGDAEASDVDQGLEGRPLCTCSCLWLRVVASLLA